MHVDTPIAPGTERRRNRRLALLLAAAFVALVLACALYIGLYGGANKGPMKPFRSDRTSTSTPLLA